MFHSQNKKIFQYKDEITTFSTVLIEWVASERGVSSEPSDAKSPTNNRSSQPALQITLSLYEVATFIAWDRGEIPPLSSPDTIHLKHIKISWNFTRNNIEFCIFSRSTWIYALVIYIFLCICAIITKIQRNVEEYLGLSHCILWDIQVGLLVLSWLD